METKSDHDHKPFHEENFSRIEMQDAITARVSRISGEFKRAFEFIRSYPRSVSFFGSARFLENDPHYANAYRLAKRISSELQYTILTGGGAGIMEAANKGALETGGESVGLNIMLPEEQRRNHFTTDSMDLYYFFVRKVALSFAAEAYVFFPGGFGTLDEFFDIITLIQTRKIRRVPIILYGNDYWKNLHKFIADDLLKKHAAIDEEDMSLYTITGNEDEILEIIRKAPVR